MSEHDHTRDCILPSDGKAEGLVRASELFALAAERDALRAEVERLRAAGNAIIDFYNGPLEAKRPDIFHRLMVRLNAALEEKPTAASQADPPRS